MNARRIAYRCTFTTLLAFGLTTGLSQRIAAQQPQAPRQPAPPASASDQNGVEVLTRGPLHEAFAETITFDPEPGIVAPKEPPAAIEELPPRQRPAGANLSWIPGYWAWDDERNDFLWVSGIWRALPPGRQWVPGYWGQSGRGFQWTSGYWADAAAREIDYLPEPPATVESGRNIAAPSADDMWLPGCWVWQQNRYAWRPGYWAAGNQDWDWVPDHYVWTPSGYVFVNGYYDYSVPRRGIVFAPVYLNADLYGQRGFSYSPSTVINPGVFVSHLFVRPGYGHYYFGDYYGSNYSSAGFSPWFSYQSSHQGYDPIYAGQRWQHRRERDWDQQAEANFRNYRDNENARPPRTWAAQQELARRGDANSRRNMEVAVPLDSLKNEIPFRLQPVDQQEQQRFGQRAQEYRKYVQQRQQFEAKAALTNEEDVHDDIQDRQNQKQRQQLEATTARTPIRDPVDATGPARRKLPASPYVAMPVEKLDKNDAPPQRHEVLKPDLQVQPQARTHGGQSGTRRGNEQEAAGGAKQQDSQAQRNVGSQREAVNKDNPQGAAAGQSQGQTTRGQPPAAAANRGQAQAASNGQSQNSSQGQPSGKPKKKDND